MVTCKNNHNVTLLQAHDYRQAKSHLIVKPTKTKISKYTKSL